MNGEEEPDEEEEEIEAVCMEGSAEFQEDCIDDGGSEVAKAVTSELFRTQFEPTRPKSELGCNLSPHVPIRSLICEEVPCEEGHCSNIGNDFVWNTNAVEFTPMSENSNNFVELWDLLHSGSA